MMRAALESERAAARARIEALASDFQGIVASAADMNGDDEHDPEGSTVAYERAQVTALLADARTYLAELDDAELRLAEGSYSRCASCGGRIPLDRLLARPATRTCIPCAS